jgi:hypothetical protein
MLAQLMPEVVAMLAWLACWMAFSQEPVDVVAASATPVSEEHGGGYDELIYFELLRRYPDGEQTVRAIERMLNKPVEAEFIRGGWRQE